MRTDQHEHKHSLTMKTKVHSHVLTEVDAEIAAIRAEIAAIAELHAGDLAKIEERLEALEEPVIIEPPPPPPTASATQTIAGSGTVLSGSVDWLVTFTGIEPHRVDMLIDNKKWAEYDAAPWGGLGPLDTTTLTNGPHVFTVNAYDVANNLLITSSVTATVDNTVEPPPPPPPPPPPTTTKVVNVASIINLLDALADNTVDEIVMKNGRYPHAIAAKKLDTSLYIDRRFAHRTRPVLVRAETIGGVTFDGNKATYYGGITFNDGAHDQTWRGFRWVNGEPTGTGVVVIGGYQNLPPTHNIVLEDCEVSEFYGVNTGNQGHGIYISQAFGGPHTGLVLDRFKVTDTGTHVGGGIHFYHDSYDGAKLVNYHNAHNTIIRNAVLTGCLVGFYVWAHTINDLLIEDSKVVNARQYGVRYERGENVTFRRVVTTGSTSGGIAPTSYISGGPYRYPSIPELGPDMVPGPKLVTFEDCDFK